MDFAGANNQTHTNYTVSQKGCHRTHGGKFVKSQPIFKILSPLEKKEIYNKIHILFPTAP